MPEGNLSAKSLEELFPEIDAKLQELVLSEPRNRELLRLRYARELKTASSQARELVAENPSLGGLDEALKAYDPVSGLEQSYAAIAPFPMLKALVSVTLAEIEKDGKLSEEDLQIKGLVEKMDPVIRDLFVLYGRLRQRYADFIGYVHQTAAEKGIAPELVIASEDMCNGIERRVLPARADAVAYFNGTRDFLFRVFDSLGDLSKMIQSMNGGKSQENIMPEPATMKLLFDRLSSDEMARIDSVYGPEPA